MFLTEKGQQLRVPERIFFHLVESKDEEKPFYFFELRGINVDRFISVALENKVESMLRNAQNKSDRIIEESDLTALFGVI